MLEIKHSRFVVQLLYSCFREFRAFRCFRLVLYSSFILSSLKIPPPADIMDKSGRDDFLLEDQMKMNRRDFIRAFGGTLLGAFASGFLSGLPADEVSGGVGRRRT